MDSRWTSAAAPGEPVGSLLPGSTSDSDAGVPRPDRGGGAAGARDLHWLAARAATMIVAVLQPHAIIPTLDALRNHFEAIRRAELTRLERKLARLPPEARTRLDEITRLIVEKLLLTPTEQLRSLSDGMTRARYAAALNRLFQLAVEDEDKVDDLETTISTR